MKHHYRLKGLAHAFCAAAIVALSCTVSFAGVPNKGPKLPAMMHGRLQGTRHGKFPLVNVSAIRGKTLSISSEGQSRRSIFSSSSMLDTTFNHTGTVTTAIGSDGFSVAYSVAIQPDGKIVAAGLSQYGSINDSFALARYDTDGTLDTTFGTSGKVTTSFAAGEFDAANSVAIQPDGKIVAAGFSEDSSGSSSFAIARYDADGTLDTTFGTDGKVTTVIGTGGDDIIESVALQPDGKIVAAGYSKDASGDYLFALARYDSDGTLDTTFGTGGKVTTVIGTGGQDEGNSMAIQPDGKIVVAGVSKDVAGNYSFALARYDTDGSLDNAFGTGGKVTTVIGAGGNDQACSMAIQPDGRIVAAGTSVNNSSGLFALARYNTGGTLDTTFNHTGIVTTAIDTAGSDVAYSVALQSDGKIVAAGGSFNGSGNVFALARYNTDGTLDKTFGTGGVDSTIVGTGGNAEAYSVAIQSDGRIVAAGMSEGASGNTLFGFARYLSPSDIPLAAQATDFLAKADGGSVTLSWTTQSEVNNAGFNVLREDPNGSTSLTTGGSTSLTTGGSTSLTTSYEMIASYTSDAALKGLGTSSTGRSYTYTDSKVKSGETYSYRIESVSTSGTTKDVGTLSVMVGVPKTYALYQNYPNPFNPSTTIRFDLKEPSKVTLAIYNVLGQRVEYWNYGSMDAGRYNKDVNMAAFASGVYFCRIVAQGVKGDKFVSIRKMLELK